MRVAELMRAPVTTIGPDDPVAELVRVLADAHISGLPVVDTHDRILGVVTTTDVLQAAAEREDARARARLFDHTTVRDLMTATPQTIAPDADVRDAARLMLYAEVRRLFVTQGSKLVGVISETDIAHALATGRL